MKVEVKKNQFGNVVLTAFMSGGKYVVPQNDNCSKESNIHTFIFWNKVSYQNTASLQNRKKIHLQIKLSDTGYSNFKRLVAFCTKQELEDLAFHTKMLMKSKKLFLQAHKIQNSQTSLQLGLPHMTVGLFIPTSLHVYRLQTVQH
jgi:hypothetical protein